jgi:hypothetical protein
MIRSILPNGASQLDITPIDAALLGSDLEVDEAPAKFSGRKRTQVPAETVLFARRISTELA